MSKYLLLPMSLVLLANCAQAQMEWGYQCNLSDKGYPDSASNVQRIDMFPGGAIVKVRDDNTGEFGGSGKVYKELENNENSYVIGVFVKSDATTERYPSGDIAFPVIQIDKRTLNYLATATTPRDGHAPITRGTCVRLTI